MPELFAVIWYSVGWGEGGVEAGDRSINRSFHRRTVFNPLGPAENPPPSPTQTTVVMGETTDGEDCMECQGQ